MPLISTRGGLSSRGFGQFSRTVSATLNTLTFPAGTSVFTVPATTNNLVSMVGAGADGVAPSSGITSDRALSSYVYSGSSNGTVSQTYDALKAEQLSLASTINGGGVVYYTRTSYYVGPNGLSVIFTGPLQTGDAVPGTAVARNDGAGLSGPLRQNASGFGYYIDFQIYFNDPGSIGADTTGFGRTFPGGAYGPSSTTTFSNVAVVPNQTYTIVNNKSLTITYFS